MGNDTFRSELAELRDTVHAGFARMDRYFELSQAQHVELRGHVQESRALLVALTSRVDRIEVRLDGLGNQVQQFRDWVTRELADVRHELRSLRQATEQPNAGLRRDIEALDARVTRLEQQRDDAHA